MRLPILLLLLLGRSVPHEMSLWTASSAGHSSAAGGTAGATAGAAAGATAAGATAPAQAASFWKA